MPEFVIEREVPGAGHFSAAELQSISARSCGVLGELGPAIRWVRSYVTDDKLYCIYTACNEALVREHARLAGFPADQVCAVHHVIDPTTAHT
jgi:hypothetical protein